MLSRFKHLESIPNDAEQVAAENDLPGRAASLAGSLAQRRDEALLYRKLATLRNDVPLREKLGDLKWQGAYDRLKTLCRELGAERIPAHISRWR